MAVPESRERKPFVRKTQTEDELLGTITLGAQNMWTQA